MTTTVIHTPKAGPLLTGTEYEAMDHHVVNIDGEVPVGGIIMWSGTIATIPTPIWELCDGTANAPGPDLRDKFVVGATQDDAGAAKTNIEGVLRVSTTQTGASLAAHGPIGDHIDLTHDGAVASHADLTHAALSHPALTVTHADHSVASASHSHASGADVSVAAQTIASGADISIAGGSFTTIAASNSVTRSVVTTGGLLLTHYSTNPAVASHSHANVTGSRPTLPVAATTASRPSTTGSAAAVTLTHADHSLASLSHQAIGTHTGLTHAFTPPAGHGSAGTVTHSFTDTHGTVAIVPAYYALAFIQRMA